MTVTVLPIDPDVLLADPSLGQPVPHRQDDDVLDGRVDQLGRGMRGICQQTRRLVDVVCVRWLFPHPRRGQHQEMVCQHDVTLSSRAVVCKSRRPDSNWLLSGYESDARPNGHRQGLLPSSSDGAVEGSNLGGRSRQESEPTERIELSTTSLPWKPLAGRASRRGTPGRSRTDATILRRDSAWSAGGGKKSGWWDWLPTLEDEELHTSRPSGLT